MRLETLAFRAEVDEIRALILSVVDNGLGSPSTETSPSTVTSASDETVGDDEAVDEDEEGSMLRAWRMALEEEDFCWRRG